MQRLNLIEKEPFSFTYGKLATGIGVTAGLLVVLLLSQIARTLWYEKKIGIFEEDIERIKKRQELLAKKEPPKLEKGRMGPLKAALGLPPRSHLLGDIVGRMPGSVWLTSIRINAPEMASEKKEEDSKKKKAESTKSEGKPLVLKGVARRPADLASFLSGLNGSPFIARAILASSRMEEEGFTFAIECDLAGR